MEHGQIYHIQKNMKNKQSFSKTLIIQESILIWIDTLAMLALAFICVLNQYFGELPWLAVMAGFPWAAYGTSQVFYYQKSAKENTKNGIVYESAMRGLTTDNDIPVG